MSSPQGELKGGSQFDDYAIVNTWKEIMDGYKKIHGGFEKANEEEAPSQNGTEDMKENTGNGAENLMGKKAEFDDAGPE